MMFPGSLKDSFSQAARAKQESQAVLERTRGETASLRNLANAARMLENNPNLFQLRVLQAVSEAGKVALTISSAEATKCGDEAITFYTKTLGFSLLEDTLLPEEGKRWVVVAPTGSPTGLLLAQAVGDH